MLYLLPGEKKNIKKIRADKVSKKYFPKITTLHTAEVLVTRVSPSPLCVHFFISDVDLSVGVKTVLYYQNIIFSVTIYSPTKSYT